LLLAGFTHAQAQTLLLREVVSREICVHVGGVRTPALAEVVSREATLSTAGDQAGVLSPQTLSRETDLCVATAAAPAPVTELQVSIDPTGATAQLDWSGYNELLQRDVVRYSIYLSDQPFTTVAAATPYASVGAGTQALTIGGLEPWRDHCFAVVAVDALGQYSPTVFYAASYPLTRELVSRETGLLVAAGVPSGQGQTLSREVSLVAGTAAPPAAVTELTLSASPTADAVTLDWSAYDEVLQRDVARYDIYLADLPFADVGAMAPYTTVPAGTQSLRISGLAAWRDHCFAVVAVDALGHFLATVEYSAAYALTTEVVSREVCVHVGGSDRPLYAQVTSREAALLVPEPGVPAPVTGVDSGFTATTSATAYGAVDLAWPSYNEPAQIDVARYRIYVGPSYFDDVTALTPFGFAPAGVLAHTVVGLAGGAIHYLAVVAEDALGHWNPVVRAVSAQASVSALGEVREFAAQSLADRLLLSWLPPASAELFLDHYLVYVGANPTPTLVPRGTTSLAVEGLEPAHGYACRVTTVDWIDTESGGASLLAATWLANPTGVQARAFDGQARLTWTAVTPASLLQHYAVYVAATPFASVAGLTPVLTTRGTRADLGGLTNGTEYTCAVTAVNLSAGADPTVTPVAVTPHPVPPVEYADLAVGTVAAPTQAYDGDTVTVTWPVANRGLGTTGDGTPDGVVDAWMDRVVLSRDAILGNIDDLLLASVPHAGSLLPAADYTGTWTGTLPVGVTGAFHVFIWVDAGDAVAEYPDAEQNTGESLALLQIDPPALADLVAEHVGLGVATAVFGGPLALEWTVRNAGNLTVDRGWTDAVWFSRDHVLSPATDLFLGAFPAPAGALPPGATYTLTQTLILPSADALPTGDWSVLVVADEAGRVAESDEANNLAVSASVQMSLPVLPDLKVTAVSAPTTVLSEAWFAVRFRTANVGLATAASATGWEDRLLLSTDALAGDDLLLGSYAFAGPLPVTGAADAIERVVTVRAPLAAGEYWLVAQTDVADRVLEIGEANNVLVALQPLQVESAYTATVGTAIDVAASGTPIPLTGTAALFGSGEAATHALVNIHIVVHGFTRVISALTDDTGHFQATWRPLANEGGHYTLGACHPGQATAPVQDAFDLVGLALDLPATALALMVGAEETAAVLTLRNLGEAPVTDVTIAVAGLSANLSASVTPMTIAALPGQGALALTLRARAAGPLPTEGSIVLSLASHTTAARQVTVPVTVILQTPDLVVTPAEVLAAMVGGEVRPVNLSVGNLGAVAADLVTVSIPEAPWLKLSTPAVFGPLAPGATAPLELLLCPANDLPLGPYQGQITVSPANGPARTVPFTFRMVSTAVGTLTVYAVDEYYYFTPGQPRLAGATVTLRDAGSDVPVATAVTDADGMATFAVLPEDYYQLEVTAPRHASSSSVVFVSAAGVNEQLMFLSRQTVTYVWSVVPTAVEDVTEITIEALFETNVPAPVVTVEPTVLDLAGLDEVGQTRSVNLTLRNHGWIAAQNAHFNIGTHPYFTIVPLLSDLGTLPARSSLVVPVRLTRSGRQAPGAKDEGGCALPMAVEYDFICGPRRVPGSAPVQVSNLGGNCPSAIGFPVAEGGGGGGGILHVQGAATGISTCDECAPRRLGEMLSCAVGFIPGVGCAAGLYDCLSGPEPGTPWYSYLLNCIYAGVGCAADLGVVGNVFDGLRCYCDIAHACDGLPGHPAQDDPGCDLLNFQWPDSWWFKSGAVTAAGGRTALSAYDTALATLHTRTLRLLSQLDWLVELFGDERWLRPDAAPAVGPFLERFLAAANAASEDGERISPAEQSSLETDVLPTGVDAGMVTHLVERWNRSLEYWQAGLVNSTDVLAGESQDFIALDRLQARLGTHQQALADTAAEGFTSIAESLDAARADLMVALTTETSGGGVCARVRLQINQRAVQTRDAFAATLLLENRTATPLTGVGVTLQVRNAAGQVVADLFAVGAPLLTDLDAVDGAGQVAASGTGSARWTLIPTTDAAPGGPTEYYVGGTLQYHDGAALVSVTLTPAPITVYPQPELELTYFHQRDVIGDDPWTADVTEASEPYELAVMVRNRGAGSARNLRLESAQPQIIDNEKGLLIDFKIIATEIAGENLLPTLTADFGEVAPGAIEIGRWWLTSTLQGQFVEYSATFRHLGAWDDDRLSIIKSVEILELTHTVWAGGALDDGQPDFLVSAVSDSLALPDALYLSDGQVLPVGLAPTATPDGAVTQTHRVVTLQTTIGPGWTYLRTPDPGGDHYRLARVVRQAADGSTTDLPRANYWQTDRTFIGLGQRPRLESNLHLFDAAGPGLYTLYYEPRDQAGPRVLALAAPGTAPLTTPLSDLEVTFSETIAPGSFTAADLTLTRNGGPNLISAAVTVVPLSATTYRIAGLAELNAAGGEYRLSLELSGLTDLFDNPGTGARTCVWTRLGDEPAVMAIAGVAPGSRNLPVEELDVTFSEALAPGTFSRADLTLSCDGGGDRLGPAVAVADLGGGSFRVTGLGGLTATPGTYVFRVDASGVQDVAGLAGRGSREAVWTVDTQPPAVLSLSPLPTAGATRAAVTAVDIVFSEGLAPLSLGAAALSLTRDGGSDLLDGSVQIAALGEARYHVSGLAALTDTEGDYEFSVDGRQLLDHAANPGLGTAQVRWRLDRTAPAPATDLTVTPDAGTSAADGLTNVTPLTVHGSLAESGLAVDVVDETSGRTLGALTALGTTFACPVDVGSPGPHRLQIRTTDAAGNATTSVLAVFVDLTPPLLAGYSAAPPLRREPLTEISVRFSKAIDPGTFDLADVTLQCAGEPLDLAGLRILQTAPTEFLLQGLPVPARPEGSYVLWVDARGVSDPAGNAGTGPASSAADDAGETVLRWQVDQTPPTVLGLTADATPRRAKTWTWHADEADSAVLFRYRVDQSAAGLPAGAYAAVTATTRSAVDGTWYIHVQAQDGAGNESPVVTALAVLDNTAPTVTVGPAPGQADPTLAEPVRFQVHFSEAVSGFGEGAGDVVLGGTAAATAAVVTMAEPLDGTTYTVAVSGMARFGTVTVTVPAGVASDAAANPNSASLAAQVTYSPQYRVTFDLGAHGRRTGGGERVQDVLQGAAAAAPTIEAAVGWVFSGWDTAFAAVTAPLAVTATYRPAATVAPDGVFLAQVDRAAVANGRGWWNLTGAYATTVKSNPLTMDLLHDSSGRLSGTAAYTVAKGTTVIMPVKGSVRGASGNITMKGTLRGADPASAVSVSLSLLLAVDTANRQLLGRMSGSVRTNGTTTPVDAPVTLALPAAMDGTWTLRLQLEHSDRGVAGTALLTLADGVARAFTVQGKAHAASVMLSLTGAPADPAAKAIQIRTTIAPLEGGWARLESLSGRAYGQALTWW
jgi:hypothetical protein